MTKRLCLWLLLGVLPLSVSALSIRAVQHRNFSTADFERIADYAGWSDFDGRLCLRTNPKDLDGTYFVVRLDRKVRALPPDTRIELAYLLADSPTIHRFETPLQTDRDRAKQRRVYLGLTEGAAQPIPTQDNPLTAYRIRLFAADSSEPLAVHESFLWRAPRSTAPAP